MGGGVAGRLPAIMKNNHRMYFAAMVVNAELSQLSCSPVRTLNIVQNKYCTDGFVK